MSYSAESTALLEPGAGVGRHASGQGTAPSPDALARLQRLTSELQTTLDAATLVDIFFRHLNAYLLADGLTYSHEAEDVTLSMGTTAANRCEYTLTVHGERLGQLTVTRAAPFSGTETVEIENLLCNLVYPLRNSFLYRAAVQSSLRDPLTGVYNRAALDSALYHEIQVAQRHGTPLSMIVLDIDHFKRINDTRGHTVGDCVLQHLCRTVLGCIRAADMLFRYGGEEFTVMLKNTDAAGAQLLAERIRSAVEATSSACDDGPVCVTVSAGVAELTADDDAQTLFHKADQALYRAKQAGRNRVALAAA